MFPLKEGGPHDHFEHMHENDQPAREDEIAEAGHKGALPEFRLEVIVAIHRQQHAVGMHNQRGCHQEMPHTTSSMRVI